MKSQSSPFLPRMVSTLILATLGMSGIVSAVSGSIRTEPISSAVLPSPAAANQESVPADMNPKTTGADDRAAEAPAVVVPARVAPVPALPEQAPVPNEKVEEGHAFGLRLSSDGLLPGRFRFFDSVTGIEVAAERLTISFVQNGKVMTRARPGVNGVFQVSGLTPGTYSMIASGPDGFLATGITVLPAVNGQGAANEAGLQIDGALVPPENAPLVRKLIRERIFPTRRSVAESAVLDRSKRVSQPYRTPLLTIGPDGHLRRRLHRIDPITEQHHPATECTVFLIRGREIRASVHVDQNGLFDFDARRWNLEPGEYSLLITPRPPRVEDAVVGRAAAPGSGYAAVGVTVVNAAALPQPQAATRPKQNPFQLVSAIRLAADDADHVDDDAIHASPVSAEDIEAGINGDGSDGGLGEGGAGAGGMSGSGGSGGGGGGVGGGGGGDGLLAGALLGGGAAAGIFAAVNNSGKPASPKTPRNRSQ